MNNLKHNQQLLETLSTHFDLVKIKDALETRYNSDIDPFELYVSLNNAKKKGMSTQDVLDAINKKTLEFKKPISTDLMYLGMLNLIYYKDWKHDENFFYDSKLSTRCALNNKTNLMPDFDKIVAYWFKNKDELFKMMEFKYLRKYYFTPITEDLNLTKEIKNSNLRKMQNDFGIEFKNLIDTRLIQNSHLELKNNMFVVKNNKKYIVIQGDKQNTNGDTSQILPYAHQFKLFSVFLTSMFVDEKIDGFVVVNNDTNRYLSMNYYDFKDLRKIEYLKKDPKKTTKLTNNDFVIKNANESFEIFNDPSMKTKIRELYNEFESFLTKKYHQPLMISEFYTTPLVSIQEELNQSYEVDEVHTDFVNNQDVKYYDKFNNSLLNENQQQVKFLSHVPPTPSQLNSLVYLSKDKNGVSILTNSLKKQSPHLYWPIVFKGVVNKYGFELNETQIQTLLDILILEKDITNEDEKVLNSPLNSIPIEEPSKTLFSLGHYNEPLILSYFAKQNPKLLVKSDKNTLYSHIYQTPFDIDGYIGNSLNDLDQVIEIKNTLTSKEKIVNSYWVQMTYYNEILKPKNGVKMVAGIKTRSGIEFYTEDFIPSKSQKLLFSQLYEDFVSVNNIFLDNNFFNLNDLVQTKLNERIELLEFNDKPIEIQNELNKKKSHNQSKKSLQR